MSRKSVPFNQKTASTQERDIGIASKHPWSMIWDEDIHRLRGATPETAGAFLALIPQLRLGDPQGYLSRDGRAIETKSLALVTGLDQRVIGDALRTLKNLRFSTARLSQTTCISIRRWLPTSVRGQEKQPTRPATT
jgi:hypothetical protein